MVSGRRNAEGRRDENEIPLTLRVKSDPATSGANGDGKWKSAFGGLTVMLQRHRHGRA